MSRFLTYRHMARSSLKPALLAGVALWCTVGGAQAQSAPTIYQTLNYGTSGTFLTGIRGNTIVGNYVVPGTGATGGLLYDMTSGSWSAFPVATSNGVNYPNATGSSPYGPSFGSQTGILRTVGSYITSASAPYDLGYLYDAAAAPGRQLITLAYPSAAGNPTLYTIAHSTFGDTVVGNFDTRLATGNAVIYTISTGTYVKNNMPGAVSTTAYGVYGDMISGGYANAGPGGGIGFEHGYLYNTLTGTWTTYDHPGAIITHLEGITGAGRSGEYNMVADWVTPDNVVHAGVLHVDALGIPTWYELNIPGASLVSSNSAYGDKVVGIYLTPGSTTPNGYIATLPGIYNPIRNTGVVDSSATNAAVLSGRKGDDLVNSGVIRVTGNGGLGMRGETYGVLTNTGTISASGIFGAAVEMHGVYGTLLNYGTLQATVVADALRTGPDSFGTVIVNYGVIDGRIAATSGLAKRFENSGWIGVTGTGLPVHDHFTGVFVQTAAGTLSTRVTSSANEQGEINDLLEVLGTARLNGTLAVPFQTTSLSKSYTVVRASEGVSGAFSSLVTLGLPSFFSASLSYAPTTVDVNLTSAISGLPGLKPNQGAVAGALDRAFNSFSGVSGPLTALYGLSATQMPATLSALSGEALASEQSVLIGDGLYSRQAVLDRLRQGAYADRSGTMAALAYGGPTMSYAGSEASAPAASAAAALAYAAGGAPVAVPPPAGPTLWAQGFGSWANYGGSGNVSGISETLGGVISGIDATVGNWRVGGALGYTQSNASLNNVSGSSEADSATIALYAGTSAGPWNLRLGASYAFSQIDTTRTVAFPGFIEQAKANYNAGTGQLFAEVGYGFAVQAVAFEPYAGLAWVHLNTDSFSENGAVSSALSGASSSANVGYGTLGLRAATSLPLSNGMAFAPHVSAAWQYAFGDLTPSAQLALASVPGANFTVQGLPLAQNTALVEAGLDLKLNAQMRVGASYVGQFADSVTVNAFQANFTWNF